MKRLKYLAAVNPSLPREQIPHPDTRVSFLPMERISEDGKLDLSEIRCAKQVSQGYTSMLEGDLIIAKITPCFENGKGAICSGLFGGIGYGTTELIVLRAKSEADRRFLYWLTLGYEFRKRGEAEMRGSAGQKRVTEEFVSNFQTSIRKADQLRIASYLDEATGRIDRLVGLRRRQMELLWEQRTALIQETVTRGLNPSAPLKDSGIPWLGAIPEHWEVKRCKVIFREIDNRSTDGQEELLTVSHLTGITPRTEKDEVNMFLAETNEGYKKVEIGDLVINTMWAWMGALGFSACCGIVSPSYNVYRFRRPNEPAYYGFLFRTSTFIKEITRYSTGIWESRLRLYPQAFFEIRAPIPPLEEQREILAHIQRETAKLDALHLNYERQLALLAEYRAALIHECVTGQKVVD